MRASILKFTLIIPFFLINGCSDGSDSRPISVDPPPAPDYTMPPLVDVHPPEEDFTLACAEGLPPVADAIAPAEDDTGGETGYLVDSAVAGLSYETPTHQGVTGADGGFHYEAGETVRFMLGDILLGEVEGKAQVSPFDLAGAGVPVGMPAITAALDDGNHPFNRAINTAVLLQSLDRDGDPGNGIEITPEVAALFRGVNLALDRPWQEFGDQFWLNHAIAQANGRGFFSEAHGVVNPARAVTRLYGTLGIDAMTMGISLEEIGVFLEEPVRAQRWFYDSQGNLARIEWLNDEDKLVNLDNWTWDANGNRIDHEGMEFGNESPEYRQYDTRGNLLFREYRELENFKTRLLETENWQYEYDSQDRLLRAGLEFTRQEGEEKIIRLEANVTFTYDARGRPLEIAFNDTSTGRLGGIARAVERLEIPEIGYLDLANTYTVTYEYDVDGSLVSDRLYGENAELGRITVTRSYDDHGNVILSEMQLEQFGHDVAMSTTRFEYEYDAVGNLIRKETVADASDDREVVYYQYDVNGNVTREAVDLDGDGSLDSITTYEYDSFGNLTRREADLDNDGVAEEQASWPYQYELDESGRVVRRLLDQGGNGRPGEIVTYTYHSNGVLAREDIRSNEEHHVITTWQYNHIGKLTQVAEDANTDGVPDRVRSYTYDACGILIHLDETEDTGRVDGWKYDTKGRLRSHEWTNGSPTNGDEWINGSLLYPSEESLLYPVPGSDGLERWQYDMEGRVTRHRVECVDACFAEFPGFTLVSHTYTSNHEYDAAGNITRKLADVNGDGKPERVAVYRYDPAGNKTRELVDKDGDGQADEVTSYTYDADNRLTRHEEDRDADGKPDRIETIEYDPHGNMTREVEVNGDGEPHERYTWEYDADGRMVLETSDFDADGIPHRSRTLQYDEHGNLVRETESEEADGIPDSIRIRTFQYDQNGNLVRETDGYDDDGDGVAEGGTTREYTPTGWGHLFASPTGY